MEDIHHTSGPADGGAAIGNTGLPLLNLVTVGEEPTGCKLVAVVSLVSIVPTLAAKATLPLP